MIERVPVKGGNVKSIGYDKEFEVLEVEFSSLAVYAYKKVPFEVYERFLNSDSKIHFFAAFIRANYEYECTFKPEKKKEEDREIPNPSLEKELKRSIKKAKKDKAK